MKRRDIFKALIVAPIAAALPTTQLPPWPPILAAVDFRPSPLEMAILLDKLALMHEVREFVWTWKGPDGT